MDYATGLRERKKQRTRDQIVEAAFRLFGERGFPATTVAEIAAAADIAPRTFFAYFPSKEAVVFFDFDAMFASLKETIKGRPEGETAIDALRRWLDQSLPMRRGERRGRPAQARASTSPDSRPTRSTCLEARGDPARGCRTRSRRARGRAATQARRGGRGRGAQRDRRRAPRQVGIDGAARRDAGVPARRRRRPARAPAVRPAAARERLAEALAGRLDLLEVVASWTTCRSIMRLPKASSASVPTIACSGTPAWRVRVPISPTSLPCSVCSSSLPSPVTTARDGAHARVEVERVEDQGGAGLERRAVRGPQPAGQAAGGAGHRDAARVLRERLSPARRGARASRSTIVGVGALLRPEDLGARPRRRAHVAEDDDLRAAEAARVLDRLERAGAAVGGGGAADRDEDHRRAGLRRGGDQLAGAVGGRAPRRRARPRRRAPSPEAAAISTIAVPPSSTRPKPGCGRARRAGRGRSRASSLAAELRQQRLERALAAVGHRAAGRAASARRARARGRSRPPPGRRGTCP